MREFRLFGQRVSIPIMLLSAVEGGVIAVAIYLGTLEAMPLGAGSPPGWRLIVALCGSGAVVVGMAAMGLYEIRLRADWGGLTARTTLAFAFGLMIMAIAVPLLRRQMVDLFAVTLATATAYVGVNVLHAGFFFAADAGLLRRRVLMIGAGEETPAIRELRRRADRRGFEIVAPLEGCDVAEGGLAAHAKRRRIEEIVVAPHAAEAGLREELESCLAAGIAVIGLSDFVERESGKIRLDLLPPGESLGGRGEAVLARAAKRMVDVAGALALLAVAWPLMIATAIAIKREEGIGSPLIYRQERVGKDGVPFRLMKFRSMRIDAEADGRARWAAKNDDRVTRTGRFIRKTRIDELPQLFNVLRGEMSLVGPRPERPEFVTELSRRLPHYDERHRLKPGITGWAQLHYPYGASADDAREKLQFDLYYVKNRGLLLDLIILIGTVEVVLFGKGAR